MVTRGIADEILRLAAHGGDVLRLCKCTPVDVLDLAKVCSLIAVGSAAELAIDAGGSAKRRVEVGHGSTLKWEVARRSGGKAAQRDCSRRAGRVGVDSGELPSTRQPANQHGVAADLVLAERKLVHTVSMDGVRHGDRSPRTVNAVLLVRSGAVRDGV